MHRFGVHSEVGKLRTVMVCRPGLAHQRLTPGNCKELLFDDVLWVQEAQKDHHDFVLKMRERGTEVLELHELLAEALKDKAARAWVLDRRITVNDVGAGGSPCSSFATFGPRNLRIFGPPDVSQRRSIIRIGSKWMWRLMASASPSACQ